MNDAELLQRINQDPQIMGGKPVIKGTRLTVEFIMGILAKGATITDILTEYKDLQAEDIQACLLFAANSLKDTTFMPLRSEAA